MNARCKTMHSNIQSLWRGCNKEPETQASYESPKFEDIRLYNWSLHSRARCKLASVAISSQESSLFQLFLQVGVVLVLNIIYGWCFNQSVSSVLIICPIGIVDLISQYLFLPPNASSPLLLEPLAPPPEPKGFSYPIPPAIPELEYFGMPPKLY